MKEEFAILCQLPKESKLHLTWLQHFTIRFPDQCGGRLRGLFLSVWPGSRSQDVTVAIDKNTLTYCTPTATRILPCCQLSKCYCYICWKEGRTWGCTQACDCTFLSGSNCKKLTFTLPICCFVYISDLQRGQGTKGNQDKTSVWIGSWDTQHTKATSQNLPWFTLALFLTLELQY